MSILLPTIGADVPVTSPNLVVYPPVETVVLKGSLPVLDTRFVSTYADIALTEAPVKIAELTMSAQETDCVVTIQSLTTLSLDAGVGMYSYARVSGVNTDIIGDYIPPSSFTEGNGWSFSTLSQSASILPGTPIVVELYVGLNSSLGGDIRTTGTRLSCVVVPTPLI